ncbi:Ganglioside-induced differentiation-associated protein 2 [Homalodisca vitripennis]|nr:Ganglioside-induced differentiation-associated protein 2 [Homalodisca vitripennis]
MGSGNNIDDRLLDLLIKTRLSNTRQNFSFRPVTEEEVEEVMNEVKSRAVGHDDISIMMIKTVSPYAIGAITHFVNTSLANGPFPSRWKTCIMLPLPKVASPATKPTSESLVQFDCGPDRCCCNGRYRNYNKRDPILCTSVLPRGNFRRFAPQPTLRIVYPSNGTIVSKTRLLYRAYRSCLKLVCSTIVSKTRLLHRAYRSCLKHRSALNCLPDETMRIPLRVDYTIFCSLGVFDVEAI